MMPAQKDIVQFWYFAYEFNLWAEGKADAEWYLIQQVKRLKLGKQAEENLIHDRLELVANVEPYVSSLMDHFPRCVQKPRNETPKQMAAYSKKQEDKLVGGQDNPKAIRKVNWTEQELNNTEATDEIPF